MRSKIAPFLESTKELDNGHMPHCHWISGVLTLAEARTLVARWPRTPGRRLRGYISMFLFESFVNHIQKVRCQFFIIFFQKKAPCACHICWYVNVEVHCHRWTVLCHTERDVSLGPGTFILILKSLIPLKSQWSWHSSSHGLDFSKFDKAFMLLPAQLPPTSELGR